MKHPRNIFLIGPMGAGKSAVGRYLARTLHLSFVDSDNEIESRTGVDIPFIFEKEGEAGFRKREAAAIDDFSKMDGVVLATGGGAIVDADSRSRLGGRGFRRLLCLRPWTNRLSGRRKAASGRYWTVMIRERRLKRCSRTRDPCTGRSRILWLRRMDGRSSPWPTRLLSKLVKSL